jgi:tRNA (guanine37-N1)-methyltransferase
MRFDVITLFPELFTPHLSLGVTRRAFESGQVEVKLWDVRAYGDGTHQRVDDRPFGGGPGMVMLAEPLSRALAAAQVDRPAAASTVIHFTPTGRRIDQALVAQLAQGDGAVMLCGRYEGIDQRFLDRHVTLELSLGDFVLSGGELPALALLDAVARLQPGVLGDEQSAVQDSFSGALGLLDCPHYSRPEQWRGEPVPEVLMSGNHAAIARWRREQSLTLTTQRRPDLIAAARALGLLSKADEKFLAGLPAGGQ